ncbi:MAG: EAL domain-containing protein [Alkalimonas sp.]|nr:EAL domain-containing protein [Alkalimonas sp.]
MPQDRTSSWQSMQQSYRANLQQKALQLNYGWQHYQAEFNSDNRHALKLLSQQVAGAAKLFGFKEIADSAAYFAELLRQPFRDDLSQRVQENNSYAELSNQLEHNTRHLSRFEDAGSNEQQKPADPLQHGPCILLFEPDVRCANQLANLLRHQYYDVVVETDSAMLSSTILQCQPRLILADIRCNHQHSISAEAIRSCNHQLNYQPAIVFMAAEDSFELRLLASRVGCDHVMTKPIDNAQLLSHLSKLLPKEESEPYRILLVDNQTETLRFYRHALSMGGYKTFEASDARSAYALLPEARPELVLIDLNLPGCSGQELANIIRQDPDFADTPLVFMATEQAKSMKLADDHFIQKPIAPWRLLMTVEAQVKRSRLLKQQRRAVIQRPELMQHIDTLTALPTLWQLKRELQHSQQQEPLCLMKLDLDKFHLINDVYGRETGDLVLQTIAWQLAQLLSAQDHLYRESGDEFWLLCRQLHSLEQAAEFTEHLLLTLEQISANFDVSIHFTASIGICLSMEQQQPEELMQHASSALYQAKKKAGHQYRFYDPEQQQKIDVRQQLTQTVRQAIQKRQFTCAYQPIFDQQQQLVSLELLARWHHASLGDISPALFIPLLEEQGLIHLLTRQMLEQGLPQLKQWREQWPELHLNMNFSAQDLTDPELSQQLQQQMAMHQLPNQALVIEITESILIQAGSGAFEQLKQLDQQGFAISLDDFGTGYSSLSYLDKFPVSRLKIDRSFVQRIDEQQQDKLLPAIIHLAQDLALEITAEGVETHAQYEFLKQFGCERYQGYLFSKPLTAFDIEGTAWFQSKQSRYIRT